MTAIFGISCSSWDRITNWKTLKQKGVEFCCMRATRSRNILDSWFDYNIKGAQDAGMIVIPYHLFIPDFEAEKQQSDFFVSTVMPYNPHGLAMDFEVATKSNQEPASSAELTARGKKFMDLTQASVPDHSIFTYTGDWFISEYCMPALEWMKDHPTWWVDRGGYRKYWTFTPSNLQMEVLREKTMSYEDKFYLNPRFPIVFMHWELWQVNGDMYKTPENQSAWELSLFHGTVEDLRQVLGIGTVTPPIYTDTEKLNKLWEAHPELH